MTESLTFKMEDSILSRSFVCGPRLQPGSNQQTAFNPSPVNIGETSHLSLLLSVALVGMTNRS